MWPGIPRWSAQAHQRCADSQAAVTPASVEKLYLTTAELELVEPPPTAEPLSTTTAVRPDRCISRAIDAPMTPAPTTTTSGTDRSLGVSLLHTPA